MSNHEELIEEAESWVAHTKPSVVGAILRDMISALESVRAERDAALARIAEAAKLHQPDLVLREFCAECSDFGSDEYPAGRMVEHPCPTAVALGLNEGEVAGDE